MKKVFWLLGVILVLCIFFIWRQPADSPISQPFSFSSPTPTVKPSSPLHTIEYNGKLYAYLYFSTETPDQLALISNFSEKHTASDLADTHGCVNGINGGFYTTDDMPLGGFKSSNGEILKTPVSNILIDGFVWSTDKTFFITTKIPDTDAKFFLQTGPLLRLDGYPTKITIAQDESKRRSAVGLTPTGMLVFFIVYDPESVYEGPLLSDMPGIVQKVAEDIGVSLVAAANLDGGSASAFISKDRTLQEFSPIGSFFCAFK